LVAPLDKQLARAAKEIEKLVKKERQLYLDAVFGVVGDNMVLEIKEATPVRTGALRAATIVEPDRPAEKLEIVNNQSYAAAVEFGDTSLAGKDDGSDLVERPTGEISPKPRPAAMFQKGIDWAKKNLEKEVAELMEDLQKRRL